MVFTMIRLELPGIETYNEIANEFITIDGGTFDFQHTLKTMANWESFYKKPFLSTNFTDEELTVYYAMMCTDNTFNPTLLRSEHRSILNAYINDSQTATKIRRSDDNGPSMIKMVTTEELYALMFLSGVPIECENWHFNRLLILLEVISIKTNPPKKMSKREVYEQNRQLNEARKAKYNTKG